MSTTTTRRELTACANRPLHTSAAIAVFRASLSVLGIAYEVAERLIIQPRENGQFNHIQATLTRFHFRDERLLLAQFGSRLVLGQTSTFARLTQALEEVSIPFSMIAEIQ